MENLVKVEPQDVARDPDTVLAEAKKAASALTTVIAGKPKKVIINKEQYLEFEDWQTLGRFYGLTAKIEGSKQVHIDGASGWEASALIINRDGIEVSRAEAMCMDDEARWRDKPTFQLRSMAQTRSAAKAFRNVLAWVVVLAGYRPTPAEEMQDVQDEQNGRKEFNPLETVAKKPATSFSDVMARERKRLGDAKFLQLLGANGYENVDEITDREKQKAFYKIVVGYPAPNQERQVGEEG